MLYVPDKLDTAWINQTTDYLVESPWTTPIGVIIVLAIALAYITKGHWSWKKMGKRRKRGRNGYLKGKMADGVLEMLDGMRDRNEITSKEYAEWIKRFAASCGLTDLVNKHKRHIPSKLYMQLLAARLKAKFAKAEPVKVVTIPGPKPGESRTIPVPQGVNANRLQRALLKRAS